jgi:hypothetical protein
VIRGLSVQRDRRHGKRTPEAKLLVLTPTIPLIPGQEHNARRHVHVANEIGDVVPAAPQKITEYVPVILHFISY